MSCCREQNKELNIYYVSNSDDEIAEVDIDDHGDGWARLQLTDAAGDLVIEGPVEANRFHGIVR